MGAGKSGQCIWGFINGINNTRDEALESAEKISQAARGERVYSMPNDTVLYGVKDALVCVALKLTADTPIVQWAAKFFRYLLSESEKDETHPPVIIMAHSQGAIITEHALEILSKKEREQLIIFTFGGGSLLDLDSTNPKTIETYTKQRMKYYEKEFSKISNVTVLDPDPKWKHRFSSSCYQAAVQMITKKYGRP